MLSEVIDGQVQTFEQWRSQGRNNTEAKQGCTKEGVRGKTGGSLGGKLQDGVDARGRE